MNRNREKANPAHWLLTNENYIEQLYEAYLLNPNTVDKSWHPLFQNIYFGAFEAPLLSTRMKACIKRSGEPLSLCVPATTPDKLRKNLSIFQMIDAFRSKGHLLANSDPIQLRDPIQVEELSLLYYGLTEEDGNLIFHLDNYAFGKETSSLSEIYLLLKETYCGSIGIEYHYINNSEQRKWLEERFEVKHNNEPFTLNEKRQLFYDLSAAEGLEHYLGTRFPGAKRFSLEGGDAFIPLLKELIRCGAMKGYSEVVLGMAHRGRLNTLINVMGMPFQKLTSHFLEENIESRWSGDVKYHRGFSSDYQISGYPVHLTLMYNPSHLEIISPVVMGSARARRDDKSESKEHKILPITVHGDASFIGQGVVQETLNMSEVRAYSVDGTVRVIINNRIGFTTSDLKDCRSTQSCTDIAKIIEVPIFHVNADDPEAVLWVARLALDFKIKFKIDVVIDLICYRRHGHNEMDEPSVTQPIMYHKIRQHPTVCKIYADNLLNHKIYTKEEIEQVTRVYRGTLQKNQNIINDWQKLPAMDSIWSRHLHTKIEQKPIPKITQLELQSLAQRICVIPDSIDVHSRVAKIYQNRVLMAEGRMDFDWGAAEMLAYATLLNNDISIRISGEDCGRGTFFHRHAVIHNQKKNEDFIPVSQIANGKTFFQIWDSVLSEEAVLAFEYGYATTAPHILTIWEAQFGDFANVAQVVFDQFLSSAAQKWRRLCGLVILLPHGYEGQGPEHSSARLERYLQLCAQDNMQVCIPSTPAQIYHLLRRQMLCNLRTPLIVMTPKSLLRHPLAVSKMAELVEGEFQTIISEIDSLKVEEVQRVVFCSGKVYYDLLEQRRSQQQFDVAIIRIEQLYPFPTQEMKVALKTFNRVVDFVWCQEEPKNQGAWYNCRHYFQSVIPEQATLHYVGRASAAASAVGYSSVHKHQQKKLIELALKLKGVSTEYENS